MFSFSLSRSLSHSHLIRRCYSQMLITLSPIFDAPLLFIITITFRLKFLFYNPFTHCVLQLSLTYMYILKFAILIKIKSTDTLTIFIFNSLLEFIFKIILHRRFSHYFILHFKYSIYFSL